MVAKNKTNSPIIGIIFSIVIVIVTWVVPSYIIPQQVSVIAARKLQASTIVANYNAVKATLDLDENAFNFLYGSAKDAASSSVRLLTDAQIQDRLQMSGRTPRRTSPLLVKVARQPPSDDLRSVMSMLRPGFSFQVFTVSLQGPLADVIDFIDQEIERRQQRGSQATPEDLAFQFAVITSVSVIVSRGGEWPVYQLVVWYPVISS